MKTLYNRSDRRSAGSMMKSRTYDIWHDTASHATQYTFWLSVPKHVLPTELHERIVVSDTETSLQDTLEDLQPPAVEWEGL